EGGSDFSPRNRYSGDDLPHLPCGRERQRSRRRRPVGTQPGIEGDSGAERPSAYRQWLRLASGEDAPRDRLGAAGPGVMVGGRFVDRSATAPSARMRERQVPLAIPGREQERHAAMVLDDSVWKPRQSASPLRAPQGRLNQTAAPARARPSVPRHFSSSFFIQSSVPITLLNIDACVTSTELCKSLSGILPDSFPTVSVPVASERNSTL